MQVGAKVEMRAGEAKIVSYDGESESMLDMLYFLTVPHGLDAYWADGKLVVDTREAVAEAVKKR